MEYVKALELEPGSAELQNETGIVFMEIDNYNKAVNNFMKAVGLVPDNPRLRYNFARALSKTNRILEAIVQLKIAIKLDPSHTAFRNALKRLSEDEK